MNVVEWTINNFSYWNGNVHEKVIESSGSSFTNCPRILLYPRGLNGCDEYLVMQIYGKPHVSRVLSGQLSCIDAIGSLICTQEIDGKMKKGDFYELLPKLKFTEVAALIRKNEDRHQDRFTLRCELKWGDNRAYHLYTTIDVLDSSVKIDLSTLNQVSGRISTIQYYPDDSKTEFLEVKKEHAMFSLQPLEFKENISVSTFLSILNSDSVTRTEENEHVFLDGESWTFLNSLTKEEMAEKGFSLIIRIKITSRNKHRHDGYFSLYPKLFDFLPTHIFKHYASSVPKDISSKTRNASTSNKAENSVPVLLNELMCLYQDHDFSDFQLRCGEVSFPTHKNILSARSPVFKAMLLSDMREAASDSLDIEDLDVHTLGRFLVFLYTGTVDDLEWVDALKLYYAADKYQVPTLKRECFSVFLKQVSISNVCDILSLADKHHDEELTTEAHDFILKNYNDVLRSEGWKTFMKAQPLLALKTVTYFAEENEFKVITKS